MGFNLNHLYGQTDSRWKNQKLGLSKPKDGTIGKKGCVVTAIANLHNMVFGTDINPSYLNQLFTEKKVFVLDSQGYSIVNWTKVPLVLPKLKFVFRDNNYVNALVWSWINVNPRVPVIVAVGLGQGLHFLVFKGGGQLVDSLDGKIKPTSTYKTLIRSTRYSRA